jgi:hypothetical protein
LSPQLRIAFYPKGNIRSLGTGPYLQLKTFLEPRRPI